jgi:hypothetical protein
MFYKKNRAKCLECGDVLESTSATEWSSCSCGDLKIRGGNIFLERDGNKFKELSVIEFPDGFNFNETPTSLPPPPMPPGFKQ